MISAPVSHKRLLIPRWRSLAATISTRELAAPQPRSSTLRVQPLDAELAARLARWRKSPEPMSAAELLESALVHGQEREALAAARHLVDPTSGVTSLVRSQASAVLGRNGEFGEVTRVESGVSYWRNRTREYSHDALAWVELALAQITNRHVDHAKHAMRIALQLAPHDRHVLRSAARLYFHVRDPEQAYALIRRNRATPHDPWLMAAELALAPCVDRSPAFLKPAMIMLDDGSFLPRQLTELAGAAASTYLTGAAPHRRSRKLFAQSLADPNANAIAQAEWASQTGSERFVDEERLRSFVFASEAQAMHAFSEGRYEDSLKAARVWISEEPFSSRAYLHAAGAANLNDSYADAIALATEGLRFDPGSKRLRNALAFAFGSTGQLNLAEEQLRDLHPDSGDRIEPLVAEANRGLIAMRRGELERGELLYRKAIDGFRVANIPSLQNSARAYLAREAALANHPKAREFIAVARKGNPSKAQERTIATAEAYIKEHLSKAAG